MRQAGLDMTDERAMRAVKTFRKMQTQLTAYARAITKNPKVRVVMSSQSAHTDGVNIFYRPPIALGDNLKHERALCDKRDDETKLQLCPACAVGERVRVSIYHEIGHIAGESFAEVSEAGKAEALQIAMRERGKPLVFTRNESFVYLANSINPYLGLLFNAVEDARVDLRMVTQRKGIKVMMEASTNQIFRDGVERPGQDNLPWSEQPLNAQAAVACMLRIIGYTGWESQLHPDVVRHTAMVNVQAVVDKLRNSQSAADTFGLTYPLMEALREYGYFKKPEEIPTLDNPPPEPETSDSDTNPGDDEDKGDESEAGSKEDSDESSDDDMGEGSDSDEDSPSADGSADDGDGDEADGEATDSSDDGDGEASAGEDGEAEGAGSDDSEEASDDAGSDESGEVDDQDADGSGGDREADEQEESSGDGSSSGPSDGDPASDGSDEADGGDDSQAADDADADESGESDGSEAGGDSASSDGAGDDSADDDGDSSGPGGHHSEGESSDASADGDGESREEVGDPEGGTGGTAGPGEEPDQGGADSGQGEDGTAPGEEDRDGDGSQGEDQVDADLQGRDADPWAEPTDVGDEQGGDGSGESEDQADADDAAESDPEGSGADPEGEDRDGADGAPDDQRGRLPEPEEVRGEVPEDPAPESRDTGVDEGSAGEAVPDHQHGATGDPCGCATCSSYGTPAEVSEAVEDAHARVGQLDEDDSGAEDDQLTIMIAQGNHFDTSSTEILGVREITEGEPYFTSARNPDVIPEEYIAPALLQTRRAFTDNLKANVTRNLKTGRVSSTALGRRAWNNDPRLFDKRRVPGKKSYSVLIGIDLSSSTNGSKSNWIRKAALAQAELCARAGIRFAIYGHSGNSVSLNPDDPYDYDAGWAMMMDIIVVKTFDQPWDDEARGRMQSVKSNGGNVDGHTFEYYRKRLDEEATTDRVLMYYTDGAMPAANYDEELEILTRELKRMARSGYVTLGVGVKTDSPKEHGLDTYRLDSLSDVKGVVMYLEKVIGKRG